jgi:hypothetical protein
MMNEKTQSCPDMIHETNDVKENTDAGAETANHENKVNSKLVENISRKLLDFTDQAQEETFRKKAQSWAGNIQAQIELAVGITDGLGKGLVQ